MLSATQMIPLNSDEPSQIDLNHHFPRDIFTLSVTFISWPSVIGRTLSVQLTFHSQATVVLWLNHCEMGTVFLYTGPGIKASAATPPHPLAITSTRASVQSFSGRHFWNQNVNEIIVKHSPTEEATQHGPVAGIAYTIRVTKAQWTNTEFRLRDELCY